MKLSGSGPEVTIPWLGYIKAVNQSATNSMSHTWPPGVYDAREKETLTDLKRLRQIKLQKSVL